MALRRHKRHVRQRQLIGDGMVHVDMHGKSARDNLQKLIAERITGMRELSAKKREDELHRLKSAGFTDREVRVGSRTKALHAFFLDLCVSCPEHVLIVDLI